MNTFRDAYPEYPERGYDQAFWHLLRAAQTAGDDTEGGLWRTAVVELAAAAVVALLDLSSSVEYVGRVIQERE